MRKGASQRYFGSAIHSTHRNGSNGAVLRQRQPLFGEETYRLAHLVGQIRKPDEDNFSATGRALVLLEDCDWRIEQSLANRATEEEHGTVPEHLTFNEGLKWLTGQSRPERAKTIFARALSTASGLPAEDIKGCFARHADKKQVPTPRNDGEREAFRQAASMGWYGGFTRADLLLYRTLRALAQDCGKLAHRKNSRLTR
jgi:hypothetical protein